MASGNAPVTDVSLAPRGSQTPQGGAQVNGLDIGALLKAYLPQNVNPENRQQMEAYLKTNNTKIRIMVTGPSGVGKSTLLNGIIGKKLFRTGRRTLDPVTIQVEDREESIGGITVIALDCPGLHDRTPNEPRYLQQMQGKVSDYGGIDLILYCRRMDKFSSGRNLDYDTAIIEKLTATLGKEIWKNTLFVFTFANMYELSIKPGQDVNRKFDRRMQLWKKKIETALDKCGVQCGVEVCPAGKKGIALCGKRSWFSDVWASAVQATRDKSKSPTTSTLALIHLALAKGRFKAVEDSNTEAQPSLESMQIPESLLTSESVPTTSETSPTLELAPTTSEMSPTSELAPTTPEMSPTSESTAHALEVSPASESHPWVLTQDTTVYNH